MLGLNLYIWINEILIFFEEEEEKLLLFQTNKLKILCEATTHKIRLGKSATGSS